MFQLKKNPEEVWLEIGGGENPVVLPRCMGGRDVHFDVRTCWDAEGRQAVDFTYDVSLLPLPLKDAEFDGAVLCFCLEHVGFAAVPGLLKELARVVKPGGSLVLLLPNTAAQMAWVQRPENGSGWDGKDFFVSASELLFGSQDMEGDANSHKSFFTPTVITNLLVGAGWESVTVMPHNPRGTDMFVRAVRSLKTENELERDDDGDHQYVAIEGFASGSVVRQPVEPCGAANPNNGLTCTRPKGHGGNHAVEVPG